MKICLSNYYRKPQGRFDPTVWWYSISRPKATDKRSPTKFVGSWNEFQRVFEGQLPETKGIN